MFAEGQFISYFCLQTVADGLPAGDFKSMNKSAKHLFDYGHVHNIQIGTSTSCVLLKANCLPEMKKDRIYKVLLSLNTTSWDILTAKCGCPAGKGLNTSCKHVGTTCYALVEFGKSGNLPEFLTCTQRLQEWIKPRPREVIPIPALELTSRRKELLRVKGNPPPIPTQYDPHPASLRGSIRKVTNRSSIHCPFCLNQILRAPVRPT